MNFDHIKQALEKPTSKHTFEYQEVCTELEPLFGKAIWTVPFKPGVTEYKMREAARIARKRGIYSLGYYLGILKKLP